MKMEQTQCSETSAYKIQTPGNYPEESIQHTEYGESLKSRTFFIVYLRVRRLEIAPSRPVWDLHGLLFRGYGGLFDLWAK